VYTGFWWRNLRERDHLEDLGVDGRIILHFALKKGVYYIDVAQDTDRWQADC